jgi:hypothetical protein
VHDAVIWTHKVVTYAVESRLTYIRRFKGEKARIGEERVAQRMVYSRFFDTRAADLSTNGVDGLLATLEGKHIEASLYAPAKAQAAHTFKQPMPGGNGGNPDKLTPRSDKSLKEKEHKEKKKRDTREKNKQRQNKKPEPKADG